MTIYEKRPFSRISEYNGHHTGKPLYSLNFVGSLVSGEKPTVFHNCEFSIIGIDPIYFKTWRDFLIKDDSNTIRLIMINYGTLSFTRQDEYYRFEIKYENKKSVDSWFFVPNIDMQNIITDLNEYITKYNVITKVPVISVELRPFTTKDVGDGWTKSVDRVVPIE